MINWQDKILGAIENNINAVPCDPVIAYEWPNRGEVTALELNTFTTWLVVEFDFQSDYCSLTLRGPAIRALELVDKPPHYRVEAGDGYEGGVVAFHMLKYDQGKRINCALRMIYDALDTHLEILKKGNG
jgi:hypothetical protein